MKNIIIKIIGVITALPGIYFLISGFQGHLFYISETFKGNIQSEYIPWWMTITSLLMIVILILRIVAGYGLFKLITWGKNLAIVVLSVELVIRFAGFINLWTYYDRHPEALLLREEFEKSVASGNAQDFMTISIIPSYVIAGVCIISILLLLFTDFKIFKVPEHNLSLNADG